MQTMLTAAARKRKKKAPPTPKKGPQPRGQKADPLLYKSQYPGTKNDPQFGVHKNEQNDLSKELAVSLKIMARVLV